MNENDPTVFVVDDEESIRKSLRLLLRSVGVHVETFDSAQSFLQAYDPERAGCLILDVRLPGMSGIELQEHLLAHAELIPIIFITAHGDVNLAVRAMRQGAFHFLEKPFPDQELLDTIHRAVEQDRANRSVKDERSAVEKRLQLLTPREREVMRLVLQGKANKAIAFELGISERTVEIHRARLMKKMEARSLAQLVKLGYQLDGDGAHAGPGVRLHG